MRLAHLFYTAIGDALLKLLDGRRSQQFQQCYECQSQAIVEVSREPLGQPLFHILSERQRRFPLIQQRYKVYYRCRDCHASWTDEITETQ